MQRVSIRLAFSGLVAGCALLAASCGETGVRIPETGATLEGTIMYDGQQVPFAMVTVVGSDGMATGTVGEDGRYKVENVPLGEVQIGVNTDAAKGDYMSQAMAQQYKGPEAKGKAGRASVKFVNAPAKYAEPEMSGLRTTINKGPNTYDIVIPK